MTAKEELIAANATIRRLEAELSDYRGCEKKYVLVAQLLKNYRKKNTSGAKR